MIRDRPSTDRGRTDAEASSGPRPPRGRPRFPETNLLTPPTSVDPAPDPAPPSVAHARFAGWWSATTPWLMGVVVVLALYLAWFTYDLLQNQLHQSSVRFNATMQRFERTWSLYDATSESALALKWDLASTAGPPPEPSFGAHLKRFVAGSDALQAEVTRPGVLMLSQAGAYGEAVRRLRATLAAGPPAPPDLPLARTQIQQVLDRLAVIGQEARQRQSLSVLFLGEVEDVRRQVLMAFAGIVAMLGVVVALSAQWVVVGRRERASRRRAELLAEVAEAERARAETVANDKARFLGMLSHELLTPLQSIWSTMDVIESRGRVEAHDASFTRLKESTRSLRGRISDLVDFAKMSSGRLETRIRGFQLDKLVDTALRDVEEALASKNLDVHWEAGPELGLRIYSDPARLRQIIDNLLTNAIKYTERGGISIHAWLADDVTLLRLEIADTGVGIEPEELARLFEPFYRSPVTASMAEGSGLGLAVVSALVDLMGGNIRINSRPGQGTSVMVEVPITRGIDSIADLPPRIDARLPVLVVDDSVTARRAIADVIRALGFEVYEAGSGVEGLAEAALRDYQAIVLDMQMPDLSGYDVALRLRQDGGRHQRTTLILVSAYNDLDDATAEGVFDARLDKPASRKDLMNALASATSNN